MLKRIQCIMCFLHSVCKHFVSKLYLYKKKTHKSRIECAHLQIVRPHHCQNGRHTKVRQENDRQRRNDCQRNIPLRIDRFLAGRRHTIETNETVETLGRPSHYAGNSERHESTLSAMHSIRNLVLRDGPIGWVS